MTRINVSNSGLPGVTSERTLVLDGEMSRCDIFDRGEYVGQVVYVRRGRSYGWRPAKAAAQSKLTSKVDAIRRLPKLAGLNAEGSCTHPNCDCTEPCGALLERDPHAGMWTGEVSDDAE